MALLARRSAGDLRQCWHRHHPGLAPAIAAIASDGRVVGDFTQQRQRRAHIVLFILFEQLDTQVMDHITCEYPLAKTPANVIHQFFIMTNQRSEQ
ncbi:hypothetical protein D9M71_676590 [compost metagenome]